MSLNDSRMLPARIRNMRQMNDVLNAEDIILAEIERIIDEMYQRASLLHEELVNEAWLENKLSARTGAIVDIVEYGELLLVDFILDVSAVAHIDMKDVRAFIEKWLPAHLMYRLNLLLAFEVNSTESVANGEKVTASMIRILYWRLNGKVYLDGSKILDTESVEEELQEMADTVITLNARSKMMRARTGEIPLPKVTGMAFGNGGADSYGNALIPKETQTSLNNELLRKDVEGYEFLSDRKCRYTCTIQDSELAGYSISEVALVDEDGDLIAIKNFSPKQKDADLEMIMHIDDEF